METLKKISVEVIGVEPPCPRCKKTKKNGEEATTKLKEGGVKFEVIKLNVALKATVKKYGALVRARTSLFYYLEP